MRAKKTFYYTKNEMRRLKAADKKIKKQRKSLGYFNKYL